MRGKLLTKFYSRNMLQAKLIIVPLNIAYIQSVGYAFDLGVINVVVV